LGFALVVTWGWQLTGAALAVALPLMLGGLFTLVYACRVMSVPLLEYLRSALLLPLLSALPFAACLILGRIAFSGQLLPALLSGPALGSLFLAIAYWRLLLSAATRRDLLERASLMFRRVGFGQP
jgi:hypothetical protein